MVSVRGGPSERARRSRAASVVLALMALALGVVGMVHPASAENSGGSGGSGVASMNLRLSLADPASYTGDSGGGYWANAWPEQQAPPNFACGDVVSLLARIDSLADTGAGPTERMVAFDLWLDAAPTGTRLGQGFTQFLAAYSLNDDAAATGQTTAYIESVSSVGTPFEAGAKIKATIVVSGISAPETAIVRIDTRVTCDPTLPRGGLLYGGTSAESFQERSPDAHVLSSGAITLQLVQPLDDGPPVTTPPTTEPGTDPGTGSTSTTAYVAPSGVGAVTVTKVADKAEAGVGQVIGYTISVLNSGDLPLTNVLVDDPRAGFTTTIPALGPGETATFTPEYTVTADDLAMGEVINGVTVSGANFDPAVATASTKIVGDVVLTGVSVLPLGRLVATTVPTAVLGTTLPRTGTETDRMTWWAAALLVAGAAVLTAANGRRDLDNRRQG